MVVLGKYLFYFIYIVQLIFFPHHTIIVLEGPGNCNHKRPHLAVWNTGSHTWTEWTWLGHRYWASHAYALKTCMSEQIITVTPGNVVRGNQKLCKGNLYGSTRSWLTASEKCKQTGRCSYFLNLLTLLQLDFGKSGNVVLNKFWGNQSYANEILTGASGHELLAGHRIIINL